MPVNRYFVHTSMVAGQQVELVGDQAHHLIKVMRGRPGDEIELINGKGQLGRAIVGHLARDRAVTAIQDIHSQSPSLPKLILAQSIPRANRLSTILEKVTELGVGEIWLFPSEHSESDGLSESGVQRAEAIMIAALKQCGGLYLPRLSCKPALLHWKHLPHPAYFGELSPEAPLLSEQLKQDQPSTIFMLIGPESGLSVSELHHLRALGAVGISLHPNILRTDTAAIVSLGILSHLTLNPSICR